MRQRQECRKPCQRSATALIVCTFVMCVTTVIVCSIVESQMLQMTSLRNTADYERTLYLAGAAVQHACAQLEADSSWRAGIPSTQFPSGSGNTYSATVVDSAPSTVVVTGVGAAGGFTRTIQVTVAL